MRFLALHVDRFRCQITERGRSKVVEPSAKGHPLSRVAREIRLPAADGRISPGGTAGTPA